MNQKYFIQWEHASSKTTISLSFSLFLSDIFTLHFGYFPALQIEKEKKSEQQWIDRHEQVLC